MRGLHSIIYFLISAIFDTYILIIWARLALRYFKISTLHPFAQFIYKLTDPLVKPLSHLLPSKTPAFSQNIEKPTVLLLLLTEALKWLLVNFLIYSGALSFFQILIFILVDLIVQPCNFLFYLIIVRVLMSWIKPQHYSPILEFIRLIVDPLLNFGRKFIPPIKGFDLSPVFILLLLKLIVLLLNTATFP